MCVIIHQADSESHSFCVRLNYTANSLPALRSHTETVLTVVIELLFESQSLCL